MAPIEAKDQQIELLRTLLIVQLGLAGIPQRKIRAIVGGDMNRISAILKHMTIGRPKGLRKGTD